MNPKLFCTRFVLCCSIASSVVASNHISAADANKQKVLREFSLEEVAGNRRNILSGRQGSDLFFKDPRSPYGQTLTQHVASSITATESTSGEPILLQLSHFQQRPEEKVIRLLFFFSFLKLPLPQLGLAKLLEPLISVSAALKTKKILMTYRVLWCRFLNSPFPAQQNSRGLIFFSVFSCCCSEKENEQSLGFPSRHMSAHRHPAMLVGNFKFPDFWKMKSRNNSIFLLFYSRK